MKVQIIIILKIILAVLLAMCLLKMPYSYFTLVRFSAMIIFGLLAWHEKVKSPNNLYFVFWIISAILFNPIFKISLDRDYWNVIDIIWAIILLFSVFHQNIMKKKK